jgi:hypothetical protein
MQNGTPQDLEELKTLEEVNLHIQARIETLKKDRGINRKREKDANIQNKMLRE